MNTFLNFRSDGDRVISPDQHIQRFNHAPHTNINIVHRVKVIIENGPKLILETSGCKTVQDFVQNKLTDIGELRGKEIRICLGFQGEGEFELLGSSPICILEKDEIVHVKVVEEEEEEKEEEEYQKPELKKKRIRQRNIVEEDDEDDEDDDDDALRMKEEGNQVSDDEGTDAEEDRPRVTTGNVKKEKAVVDLDENGKKQVRISVFLPQLPGLERARAGTFMATAHLHLSRETLERMVFEKTGKDFSLWMKPKAARWKLALMLDRRTLRKAIAEEKVKAGGEAEKSTGRNVGVNKKQKKELIEATRTPDAIREKTTLNRTNVADVANIKPSSLTFTSDTEKEFIKRELDSLVKYIKALGGGSIEDWTATVKFRKGGKSAGKGDITFISPNERSFRSKLEVARFLGVSNAII